MKSTKSLIAERLKKLEKFGYIVKSFGDNRRGRTGTKGWVDSVVFNVRTIVFIEVKTKDTNDSFYPEQKEVGKKLSSIATMNKHLHYIILKNLGDTEKFIENLLGNKL